MANITFSGTRTTQPDGSLLLYAEAKNTATGVILASSRQGYPADTGVDYLRNVMLDMIRQLVRMIIVSAMGNSFSFTVDSSVLAIAFLEK